MKPWVYSGCAPAWGARFTTTYWTRPGRQIKTSARWQTESSMEFRTIRMRAPIKAHVCAVPHGCRALGPWKPRVRTASGDTRDGVREFPRIAFWRGATVARRPTRFNLKLVAAEKDRLNEEGGCAAASALPCSVSRRSSLPAWTPVLPPVRFRSPAEMSEQR